MGGPQSEKSSSTDEDNIAAFRPRAYQLELYEQAKKQNSILVLGTGSGKTFISILLIKELAEEIRKSRGKKRKWTVFVVNTVPLVYQQGRTIEHHTALKVGMYEGSKGVDYWTDEQWETELENNEVIVMVAQIFLDLLLHSRLSMKLVNLLILDECHHATGAHPMREIMRMFETCKRTPPRLCPRVMGLTACVLHRKCKVADVMEKIKDLEITMNSALVTSIDVDEVMKHTTKPKEKVICFSTGESSEYLTAIKAQLTGIEEDVNEMKMIEPKHKKIIIKKLANIVQVMSHLGDWCGARAVKYEMEHFEEAEESEEIPALRTLKKLLCQRLEQIHEYCVREELQISNPIDHVTCKVRRLFDIFRVCNRNLYGLIFVERRNTAKLLYDLLQEAANASDDLSFIKPLYVVGANSRVGTDTVIQNELRKQKVTLDKFKRGECNFLVSTSVLEEGVDIRKCNVVIRFDKPVNYRSYVQSRGRARATPSTYILLVEHEKLSDLLESIYLYREIETALRHICHNRQLPTDDETKLHFAEDEHIAPYEPYGPDGPKITFNSAIPLINVYCGQLPQDKFTELVPDVSYETLEEDVVEKGNVRAGIKLPINSCLKSVVYGDWMPNRDHAKRSAALCMCKKLHQMGELKSNLRPAEKMDDSLLEGLVELPIEEAPKKGAPEPGTRKRRQVYNKEVCQAFNQLKGHLKLYSINVQCKALNLSEIMIDSNQTGTSVGLICIENLSHCPFPLYSSKWEEVEVRIRCLSKSLNVSSGIINQIHHFHKIVFQHLIYINPSLFEYCTRKTGVLIVPIAADSINFSLLQEIAQLDSLKPTRKPLSPGKVFNFERSTFQDAIIYPIYGPPSEPMFYVTEIFADLTPRSKFPDANAEFASYEDYFFLKYDMNVTNQCQPLIAAKHLPKELNYCKKLTKSMEKREKKIGQEPPKFVPELCGVFPLKASLWWQIMLVPSILQRLNSFTLSRQLTEDVKSPSCPLRDEENETMDFNWTEKFVKKILKPKENLSVLLEGRTDYSIHPFMIVNALTLRGAHDNFDMERLEVLGDSFLKFIIAKHLFLKYTDEHEGRLSQQRSLLVCNKTLYSLAKQRNIPEKIQGFVLNPNINGMLPGFVVKPQVAQKLQILDVPFDMWPRLPDFGTLEDLEMDVNKRSAAEKKGVCYNPWTQQELADKSVADCVEALIGVHLLVGGSAAAIDFLHMLGIGVFNNESLLKTRFSIPSAVLCKESWASEEIKRYYDKSCLDRLEEKIQYNFKDKSYIVQAVTHSSFCQNKVTDCYQRLEFLGDAVLDYLMTGMIYSCHSNYSPGQMSDLRSHYVKNETLALVSAKKSLQQHLLHMAPKLQASIDKYLSLYQKGINDEEELNTEEDEEIDWEDVDVPKVLGDLVEAIIGAVYLDSGLSLTETWDVVQVLMGDIIEKMLIEIPLNCIRELYEKLPGEVKFVKMPLVEGEKARYRVEIPGLEPLERSGKNFRTAKIAAAKLALRKLKELEAGRPSSSSALSV